MSGAKTGKKVPGYSIGQPTYLVLLALEVARRILRHEYPRKNVTVPVPDRHHKTVKDGVTVFPQLQDSFFTPFTDISPAHIVDVPLTEVLTGKTTRPAMTVRLPAA